MNIPVLPALGPDGMSGVRFSPDTKDLPPFLEYNPAPLLPRKKIPRVCGKIPISRMVPAALLVSLGITAMGKVLAFCDEYP
jgi:hypothetical protein